MGRIARLEESLAKMESKLDNQSGRKKKRFKLPGKFKRFAKKSGRSLDQVVVQYLTIKQQVIFKLCRIISGNLIVVNNKVHILNPNHLWKQGKYMWYIVREIDRLPVSNEDYDKVKIRRDDTEADVPLIKAAVGAVQKQGLGDKKNTWIVIGIIAAVAVVAFVLMS